MQSMYFTYTNCFKVSDPELFKKMIEKEQETDKRLHVQIDDCGQRGIYFALHSTSPLTLFFQKAQGLLLNEFPVLIVAVDLNYKPRITGTIFHPDTICYTQNLTDTLIRQADGLIDKSMMDAAGDHAFRTRFPSMTELPDLPFELETED